jgi:hypothetical protein
MFWRRPSVASKWLGFIPRIVVTEPGAYALTIQWKIFSYFLETSSVIFGRTRCADHIFKPTLVTYARFL